MTDRTDEDRLKSAGYTYNDLLEVWFGPGGNGCGTLAEALAHLDTAPFRAWKILTTPSNTGDTQ